MLKGWGFVARHVARERFCLVSSALNAQAMLQSLIKTLQVLGCVRHIFLADDNFTVHLLKNVVKPCVVFYTNGYTQRHIIWTLCKLMDIPDCVILLVSSYVTAVPDFLLRNVACILWEMPYYTSVPFVAQTCPMINKFMHQRRRALLDIGPLLCIGHLNMCCTLDFSMEHVIRDALIWQLVVGAQRKFRKRLEHAITIQRFAKDWLYRPNCNLGKHIVQRLTLKCQVK